MLDQTPLLDIKPFMPDYDSFAAATMGWAADVSPRRKPAGRE